MGNWTYYPTQLATSQKDQVRALIGDTVQSDPQLQDEEINFFLSMRATVWGAAAECCLALASKFSRSVDQAVGTAKASYSQMEKAYIGKAALFNCRAASMGSAVPYAGGVSVTDMLNQLSNEDRVAPNFTVGLTDDTLPVAPVGNESEVESSLSGDS